jgi:hypothetical protein
MDWQDVFERVTRLVMNTPALDFLRQDLPSEDLAKGSLSRLGASRDEIQRLETRLGTRLPPSYLEFIAESNGFLCFPGLGKLSAIAEVGWFRDLNREWCEILEESRETWAGIPRSAEYPNDNWPIPYVRELLQISTATDDDIVLLNPKVVSADGEWEAYSLYSHGSSCYRSFGDLILGRLEKEEGYYKDNPEDPLAHLEPLLDLTRRALAGQTREVKHAIERRYQQGERAAALPLAEIAAFEWNWQACSDYVIETIVDDPQAVRDLRLPCLWALCASHLDRWGGADTILNLLPSPSLHTAEIYHRRIAAVRHIIQNREWTGLSGRIELPSPGSGESDDEGTRRQAFESYCQLAEREYPRNWNTPERADRTRWVFAIAYRLPDVAMEIARRRQDDWLPDQNFEIARCYAEIGRLDDAWQAVLNALRYWQGPNNGGWTRVAPVELLIDRAFEQVMTLERCLQVLATGRPPLTTKVRPSE